MYRRIVFTGVTNIIEHRISEHNAGLDRYSFTYSRRPVVVRYVQEFDQPEQAIKAEKQVKGWSRAKKEALIQGRFDELVRLSQARNK